MTLPIINGSPWTATPVNQSFIQPYNEPFDNFRQNVLGGIALNDGSKGRMFRQWTIFYDRTAGTIFVGPRDLSPTWSRNEPGITSVTLAFDSNMNLVVGWRKADGVYLYYFDILTNSYIIKFYAGATACRLAVDDPREFNSANSDVIFVYTLNNKVYYRQQRDRYNIEYYVGDSSRQLERVGPTVGYRFKIELI